MTERSFRFRLYSTAQGPEESQSKVEKDHGGKTSAMRSTLLQKFIPFSEFFLTLM